MRLPNARESYERTICSCSECVEYCKHRPGSLVPSDIKRIEEHLGEPIAGSTKFQLSLQTMVIMNGELTAIPTIIPQTKEDGSCIFLDDETGKCKIHEVSPYGCSHFDAHISDAEGHKRSHHGITDIIRDIRRRGKYYQILNPWMEEALSEEIAEARSKMAKQDERKEL